MRGVVANKSSAARTQPPQMDSRSSLLYFVVVTLVAAQSLIYSVSDPVISNSDRFISFARAGGANNIRQAFGIALLIARFSNLTLVMPDNMNPVKKLNRTQFKDGDDHDRSSWGRLELVFNFTETQSFVRIVTEDALRQWDPTIYQNFLKDIANKHCGIGIPQNEEALQDSLARLSRDAGNKANDCHVAYFSGAAYGYILNPGKDLKSDYQVPLMMGSIKFRSVILQVVDIIMTTLPSDYIAVHFRGGDKPALPLLNCSEFGFSRSFILYEPCSHRSDSMHDLVTFEEVLLNVWKIKKNSTIYVGTYDYQASNFKIFAATLRLHGMNVATLSSALGLVEQALKEAKLSHLINKGHFGRGATSLPGEPFHIGSWIDQLLCIRAQIFLPHASSTWSEFVVMQRKYENIPNADYWLKFFSDFKLRYKKNTGRFNLRGTDGENLNIPNFFTRCPQGTSVVEEYCVCDDRSSNCVGPVSQCTSKPHPKSYFQHTAFLATCAECSCSILREH